MSKRKLVDKRITISVTDETAQLIRQLCEASEISMSQLVRDAIEFYLDPPEN